jgi:DNA-binding MarR family transcriptional regulator
MLADMPTRLAQEAAEAAKPAAGGDRSAADGQASMALLTIRLIGRLRAHHVSRLAAHGLSLPEANALLHLRPEQPMVMRELAELMGYDKSNLTGVVAKLEARRLIERDQSRGDRRTRAVVLTSAGSALRTTIDEQLTRDTPLLAGLTVAQQRQLRELLGRLDAHAERDNA